MATFEELLKKRRSIREYTNEKVNPEVLLDILQKTCQAPSAMNLQPWRFIIINNLNLIKKISDESKKNLLKEIRNNPNSILKKYEDRLSGDFNVFYNAPCLVLIVGKNNNGYLYSDCSLAAAYFMLAAVEKNLGTCWIGLGEHIEDPELKQEIGIPPEHEIAAAIIVGHPKYIPEASVRTPIILKNIL